MTQLMYNTSKFVMAPAAILSTTLLTSAALTPSNISVSMVAISSVGCVANSGMHICTTHEMSNAFIIPDVDSAGGGGGFMYCK